MGDPSVDRLTVEGPLNPTGPGKTPSRAKIFVCTPRNEKDELPCARKIIAALLRRAYRRPHHRTAIWKRRSAFISGAATAMAAFEAGIESALQFILTSPEFLFRFEPDPHDLAVGAAYQLGDVALASRLAFFLWSSPPDDELIESGEPGQTARARRAGATSEANAGGRPLPTRWWTISPSSGCSCET